MFGPNWETALSEPVMYDEKQKALMLPMYRENKDGSMNFGMFHAK